MEIPDKGRNAQTQKLHLIKVVKSSIATKKGKKLSEQLTGSITAEQAESIHKELLQMRNEWNRNT